VNTGLDRRLSPAILMIMPKRDNDIQNASASGTFDALTIPIR
jgi:hypothetical protein